jgi:hypothetical protein
MMTPSGTRGVETAITPKSSVLAVGVAILAALLAGCGGGSKSSSSSGSPSNGGSSFVSRANAACATNSTTQGGVYETMGERYKPGSGPWAAGIAAGQAVALQQMYNSLHGLTPPSGQAATYKQLVSDVGQGAAAAAQARSASARGDQAAYKTATAKLTALSNNAEQLARRIGLAACANNDLSSADRATITHIVTTSPTSNDPSQCTKEMTPAFVKQQFGTMAECIRSGKTPPGPNNPQTVNVSSITGAGDFAVANAVFHFSSGKSQNLSVALYKQSTWRLLGVQGQ